MNPVRVARVAGLVGAVFVLLGCTPATNPASGEDAATIDVSGYGFTVEEVTDDLVLPYGIAVGPDNTTYLVAGEEADRYLVVWRPDIDEWHVVSAEEGGFDDPRHVSVSATGEVFVANAGNDSISVGQQGGSSWSTLTDTSFDRPVSVAIGAVGELAVVNAGNASISVSLDTGESWSTFTSEQTGLQAPTAIDVTVDGAVIISDAAADAVAVGAGGGESWITVGHEAGFSMPVSVDSGPDGKIYVANAGNTSLSWSEDHGQSWSIAPNFGEIAALAVGPDGSLFVTDGLNAAARVSTLPGPVENLRVIESASGITVEWAAPLVTGGNEPSAYIVSLVAVDGSESEELAELIEIVDAGATSFTFPGVEVAGLAALVQASNDNGPGSVASQQVAQ